MRKIFDLFLFLLSIWLLLMFGAGKVSVEFAIAGLVSAALVAILSFLLGLVNDQSKFLFLSLRFYSHFIRCYFTNFGRSLNLIFHLALGTKSIHPTCEDVKIFENYQPDQALLIASINMISGLMVVGSTQDGLKIYALDEDCLSYLDLLKTSICLQEINDDDLV